MEFDEYVAARRATLVRAVALLGCSESEASHLVAEVLSRSARQIKAADNPDPEIYRALIRSITQAREQWPTAPPLPVEDDRNAAGLAVRRALADLDPEQRDVLVLLHHGDLTPRETAEATRTKLPLVGRLALRAQFGIGAADDRQTRGLLQQAADSIEVSQTGAIVPVRGARRWPWITAASAVAVAVAVTAVLAGQTSNAKVKKDEDDRLAADQVPSVFSYDTLGARARLESLGLEVNEFLVPVCDTLGRALETDPPTGARFDRGDAITLMTASPSGPNCEVHYEERTQAWRFIDFANGRGRPPRFADEVYLVANGSTPEPITGAAARDPSGWGGVSAVKELRAFSARVVREAGSTYATPTLSVMTRVPPRQTCGIDRPVQAGRRTVLRLTMMVIGEPTARCPLTVDLYRSATGIDAVVLYTDTSWADQAAAGLSPPPWVTGVDG